MPTQTVEELEQLAVAIFRAMGSDQTEAEIVGRHLVEANLAGHDSHGVLRIPQYIKAIRDGRIRVNSHVTPPAPAIASTGEDSTRPRSSGRSVGTLGG